MEITSVNNEKIKTLFKLHLPKNRREAGLYLVEGEHLVTEASVYHKLVEVIATDEVMLDINVPITIVTNQVMAKLSLLPSPSSIIGVCKMNEPKPLTGNVLCLDNVQDPGNLGTIIRSANAFGIADIILGAGCVDLYNDKVIRATQGMHFALNIMPADLKTKISYLKEEGYTAYGTKMENSQDIKEFKAKTPYLLLVGSEGKGVDPELLALCDEFISIKTSHSCESLNVAVATSIILHELSEVA